MWLMHLGYLTVLFGFFLWYILAKYVPPALRGGGGGGNPPPADFGPGPDRRGGDKGGPRGYGGGFGARDGGRRDGLPRDSTYLY